MAEFKTDAREFQIIPFFFSEAVQMDFKSREAGRPIFEDQEFVRIVIPGNRGSVASERVNEEHKARWPEQYAAFKAGRETPMEGVPLREWPHSSMTASKAAELAYFNIFTVEQLAAIADDKLQNIGMGAYAMREAAKKFLEVARTGTAPLERMISENIRLTDEVVRLTRELTEANAQIVALSTKDKANAAA